MQSAFFFLFLASAAAAGPYQPTWASLDARPLPSWYDESKIGIFIHWGVFSVPSWGDEQGGASGEWFWWEWQGAKDKGYIKFMEENYRPDFTYPDFAAQFKAELFNATYWGEVFKASGAKYIVPTSKHHEGWCNFNSSVCWNWNSLDLGPRRDLVGELAQAVRAEGLTFGAYHSLFEWFNPLYLADKKADFKTNTYITDVLMPELHDLVNKYQVDLIWSDGDWEAHDTYWESKEFLAWLYNESPVKDKVVVNDRWGIGDTCHHGGYYTCQDRYNPGKLQNHKWENAMTLDKHSWGYRRNAVVGDYLTIDALLNEVTSTVSCGGNILINIGPTHDGRIPDIMEERLRQMGSWLAMNGEGIYKSQPWRVQKGANTKQIVWYTQQNSTSTVYAFWTSATSSTLDLQDPVTTGTTAVELLGYTGTVPFKSNGATGLTITFPTDAALSQPFGVWGIKLSGVH